MATRDVISANESVGSQMSEGGHRIEHTFEGGGMSAGVVDQKQRLAAARKALMQVEASHDMRSVSSSFEGASAGVYHLDGRVQGLAEGLVQILGADQYAAIVGVDDVSWEGVSALGVDVSRVVVIRNGGGDKNLVDQGMKIVADRKSVV